MKSSCNFSITIKLSDQSIPVCISSDDNIHYLIVIYPPIEHLHISLLERHTQHLVRLINFLFGSIYHGLFTYSDSIEYFFDVFFYRLNSLLESSIINAPILKNIRLVDEFLPAQFDDYGTCPKLNFNDHQLLFNIDCLLTQLECQNFNECSNENDFITNRYRRIFFLTGSVLFHRIHLLTTHLSNQTTNNIYRFLLHYGHLNMSQFYSDKWHLVLFKEIFPSGFNSKQRSFLIVSSHGELTLAATVQTEHENNDFK